MNPSAQNRARIAAAVVPLALFALAWLALSPPGWVRHLKRSLVDKPGVVVLDEALSYDPSDLNGLIWVPSSALKKHLMEKVERVLWVRPLDAEGGDLHGWPPKDCRKAHGIQLCLVQAQSTKPWVLSDHLKGLKATTSKGACQHPGNAKKCAYGEQNWEYIRAEKHRFAGKKRACIWSHPVAGEAVHIQVPKVAAGRYIWGAGITDGGMHGGLPAVVLELTLPSGQKKTLKVGTQHGFKEHEAITLAQAGDLSMRISVSKTGARFLCWNLRRIP